jgi:predicted Fe-Mo cluster-binding NifX family protein
MRIAVSAQGDTLESPTSPVFGRCTSYLFVDSETMSFEAVPNPAINQGGGAGIQAAQFVVNRGAQVVLTGNLGPNAFAVLRAAGVPGYLVPEGSVRQAVEAYKAGRLEPMVGASVADYAGMGAGRRMGMGRARGPGTADPTPPARPEPATARGSELEELRETLKGLRQQLAATMERIEQLEKES